MPPDENAPAPPEPQPTPVILPFETKSSAQYAVPTVESVLKTLQNVLSLVVGAVAILTASGFVIVNSYLGQYTDIHSYGILPSQYLSAGVGLAVFVAVLAIFSWGVLKLVFWRFLLPPTHEEDSESVQENKRLRLYSWLLLTVIYSLGFGYIYGIQIYGSIPRSLGGGKPVPIYIVFKVNSDRRSFGINPNPELPDATNIVLLLAELQDALLVYIPCPEYIDHSVVTGGTIQPSVLVPDAFTIVVKNELIKGIIDRRAPTDILEARNDPRAFCEAAMQTMFPEETETP